jgi:hypothetical protein
VKISAIDLRQVAIFEKATDEVLRLEAENAHSRNIVELSLQVPGRYVLVDHSLSRMQRGLSGYLIGDGPGASDIFKGTPMPGSRH